MKVSITSEISSSPLNIVLQHEGRELAHLLSVLDSDKVTGLKISEDEVMTELPETIGRFKKLVSLEIERCYALVSFPKVMAEMPSLKRLSLRLCADFSDISTISHIHSLECLSISECDCLSEVSASISSLGSLRALDLSHCERLSWIDLSKMPESLRILDLHGDESVEFDDATADALRLVSLKIQDYGDNLDWDEMPVLERISRKIHRSTMPRQSSGLDD